MHPSGCVPVGILVCLFTATSILMPTLTHVNTHSHTTHTHIHVHAHTHTHLHTLTQTETCTNTHMHRERGFESLLKFISLQWMSGSNLFSWDIGCHHLSNMHAWCVHAFIDGNAAGACCTRITSCYLLLICRLHLYIPLWHARSMTQQPRVGMQMSTVPILIMLSPATGRRNPTSVLSYSIAACDTHLT